MTSSPFTEIENTLESASMVKRLFAVADILARGHNADNADALFVETIPEKYADAESGYCRGTVRMSDT